MLKHKELTKQSSVSQLEAARDEWIEHAVGSGFVTLCYLLATELGQTDKELIQGARRHSTIVHTFTFQDNIEITVFSSIGDWLPDIKSYETKDTVLVGKGRWPKYKELYCDVTLSNNPDRTIKGYEFFVPGKWQEQISALYDEVHKAVSANDDGQQERQRQKLLDQLLIDKEI